MNLKQLFTVFVLAILNGAHGAKVPPVPPPANNNTKAQQALRAQATKLGTTSFSPNKQLGRLSVASRAWNASSNVEFGKRLYRLMREVAKEIGQYKTEEQIKESTEIPENEPLLKWLYRVQRIHRMFFQIPNHFKNTRILLTRKDYESRDEWLNRVERMLLEREALTVLYKKTNGDHWKHKTKWNTDTNICEWHGVDTCNDGSVTELDLWDNNLTGLIPTQIGQLTNIQFLRLNNNQLSGPIPTEIGQLTKLIYLKLNNNILFGSIPSEIGQLRKLFTLYLHKNELSGTIPTEIGQLQNLRRLCLNDNQLSGPIPEEIGQLTELEKIILSTNNLSGPIPKQIGQLRYLRSLNLQNNNLTGPIPSEFGQLRNLQILM